MVIDVDHHASTLDGARREGVNSQRHRQSVRAHGRRQDFPPRYITVVEAQFRLAIAIQIELVTDMGKAVPLRRVLSTQRNRVIAADVTKVNPFVPEAVVEKGAAIALGCRQHGRKSMWGENTTARVVER